MRQLSSEPRQVICAAHGGTSGSHIGPCLELRLERLKKKGLIMKNLECYVKELAFKVRAKGDYLSMLRGWGWGCMTVCVF